MSGECRLSVQMQNPVKADPRFDAGRRGQRTREGMAIEMPGRRKPLPRVGDGSAPCDCAPYCMER